VCRQCGQGSHPRQSCTARDATCLRCNRRGHFSSQCLSSTATEHPRGLNEIITEESLHPTYDRYLYTVNSTESNSWEITIEIQSKPITFKVDIGAEVTAVSTSTWKYLNLETQLRKPDICLYGPDRSQFKVLGMLPVSLCYRDNSCTETIYITDELMNNLLGLPAIKNSNC